MSGLRSPHVCVIVCLAALVGCRQEPAPQPASAQSAQQPAAAPAPAPAPAVPPAAVTAAVDASSNDVDTAPSIADADLPPLPVTPFPAARPMEIVRAVYIFAAKHPEVLSKVPCFCGCENQGHRHNDDCFVAARDARGRPTAWEPHGLG
jgi:hypothetical protein